MSAYRKEEIKAVIVRVPGGADQLTLVSIPMPRPGPNEVLIKVHAAGVNRADIYQRLGKYPPPPAHGVQKSTGGAQVADALPAPEVLGLEVAGEIYRLGQGVTALKIGDPVMALLPSGGYAEFVVAHAELCIKIPKNLSFVQAAAVPESYFTVWSNVFQIGQLKKDEVFLVHGGTSGVGSTAIQLTSSFGAKVYSTARTKEKCDACVRLGAMRAINYQLEDFVEVIKQLTHGHGADVILDMVGGDYFPRNLNLLARFGRLVHIDSQKGTRPETNLLHIIRNQLLVTGSVLRSRPIHEKIAIAHDVKKHLLPLLRSGHVVPLIAQTFSFDQVAEAHRMMEESRHIGKIILMWDWE